MIDQKGNLCLVITCDCVGLFIPACEIRRFRGIRDALDG